jgi:hypothetical protein
MSSSIEKSATWHHAIDGEVSRYNPYLLRTGSTRQGAGGYVDSDKSIHPRHPSSHRLWVDEIPSVCRVTDYVL